jgi:hypothetical protein
MENFYMLFLKIILSMAMLLQLSCSFIGVRTPAEKYHDQSITIDDILSVKKGSQLAAKDFQSKFMQYFPLSGKTIVLPEASNDLPDDIVFRLQLDIINDKYVFKILHENEYGKGKSEDIIRSIKKNTADFFSAGGSPTAGVPNGTMATFYKKFTKPHEFKPVFTSDGNITCKDLLKLF